MVFKAKVKSDRTDTLKKILPLFHLFSHSFRHKNSSSEILPFSFSLKVQIFQLNFLIFYKHLLAALNNVLHK